ncbi:MAG: amino acid adenylation domain-containing protein [Atopobiaceae bacterium]|jgi:D-alanine--poly(phosphoribitol) ligase subunit 1
MKNVLDWLEATAKRLPDKTAVLDPVRSLTFSQLEHDAQAAGSWLAHEISPRSAVALFIEKSTVALSAMLGAVWAGGFYCALDVHQPKSRILSICETLKPAVILTDDASASEAASYFADAPYRIVPISSIFGPIDHELLAQRRRQATDVDPLYVTFTSGSTGTPKGVVTAQRGVLDFVPAFVTAVGITEADIHGNQAPFDFDASVKDIYSSLYTGSTVVIIPRAYFLQPTKLMDYVADHGCTTLVWAVGAMGFVTIMNAFDYRVPTSVNKVLFSGEVMPPKELRHWRRYLPNAKYVNLYGPTETTCNCTYFVVDRDYENDETIPAGKPFADERVFLLDENNVEVTQPGMRGEVCVSGTTLALGYLDNHEKTAAAFMQNPAQHRWLETIYRTGDLATWNEDGNLVYATRKDNQIKHMGQRIELGEIEAAARRDPGVENACCLYDHKRKKIRLFYVGSTEKDALLRNMHETLPEYMIPNSTKQLDQFPLTSSGKINRKELKVLARIKD